MAPINAVPAVPGFRSSLHSRFARTATPPLHSVGGDLSPHSGAFPAFSGEPAYPSPRHSEPVPSRSVITSSRHHVTAAALRRRMQVRHRHCGLYRHPRHCEPQAKQSPAVCAGKGCLAREGAEGEKQEKRKKTKKIKKIIFFSKKC